MCPHGGQFWIFSKFLIRIFIVLWRVIFGPKMKYIRRIGPEIFNVLIYGAEGVNVPAWWPFWNFSNFLIRIFIALWRAIFGPKMKCIPTIGSEIFNVFIYRTEGVNVPVWWPFWIFFKIFNKDIYCPMKGYIGAKNEVYLHNRVWHIHSFQKRDGRTNGRLASYYPPNFCEIAGG